MTKNRTTRVGAALLILVGLAATRCSSQVSADSAADINGQYLVRFDSAALSTAHVDCQIPVKGIVKMSEMRTENLDNGWATFIQTLTMSTPEGKAVHFQKTSKTEWTLENKYTGTLRISYDVDFSFASKPWKTGNHTAAYYNGTALFTVGRALFVYSDQLLRARVTFQVPRGMRVSTPWQREGSADVFLSGGPYFTMHNLVDNTVVIGQHEEKVIETGNFRLQLCLLDSMSQSSSLISNHLERILKEYLKIFGAQNRGIYQITIFKADGDGGESYLNSFAAVTTKPPGSTDAIIWANTLAHELFHYWNGVRVSGGMDNYYNTQWFSEGATEYYANLALSRSGVLDVQQWLDKLAMHASMYLFFKRGAPYPSDLSLVAAGRDKWKNTPGIYDGGAFVAFCLDSFIRRRTNDRHSLDDVMRYMDQEFGSRQRPFAVADVSAAVKASTNVDVSDLIDSYVIGTKTIDVQEYLSGAALNAHVYQYEVYLTIECASPPLNRRILHDLSGQKITVCP